jgi:hypothetical protein
VQTRNGRFPSRLSRHCVLNTHGRPSSGYPCTDLLATSPLTNEVGASSLALVFAHFLSPSVGLTLQTEPVLRKPFQRPHRKRVLFAQQLEQHRNSRNLYAGSFYARGRSSDAFVGEVCIRCDKNCATPFDGVSIL